VRGELTHSKWCHMTHCLVNLHITITGHPAFVLVSTEWVMICPVIDNAATCGNPSLIKCSSLQPKCNEWRNCKAVMQNVQRWENMVMMKSEVVGQPSVVSGNLVQSAGQNICERRRFTISELSCEFPQISCTALYEIITVRLDHHHKLCTRWVPKMLTSVHKTQRMASPLTFLEWYPKMVMNFSITLYEQ
jgi:hypothetical protein